MLRRILKTSVKIADCNKSVGSPVSGLGVRSSPHAILFAVSGIIVSAFQRMTDWRDTHVRYKVPVIQPPLAHSNPTLAIILPLFVVLVFASSNHSDPYAVDFKLISSLCSSMNCLRHKHCFLNVVFSGGRPAATGAHCEINKVYGVTQPITD